MDNGIFSEDDRKTLKETYFGVIQLLQWKDDHRESDEKFQITVVNRLNEHRNSIKSLQEWRWYIIGLMTAIGVIITFIIELKR